MSADTTPQPDWATLLRSKGLRVTQPRLVVLETLRRHPHSSVEEILQFADPKPTTLSVQSVYNVVADLGRHRLLRSLELPNQPGRFEIDVQDNHHHAICTSCGLVMDVPCAVGHQPCLTPALDHGMAIEVADVQYRGLCETCRDSTDLTRHSRR